MSNLSWNFGRELAGALRAARGEPASDRIPLTRPFPNLAPTGASQKAVTARPPSNELTALPPDTVIDGRYIVRRRIGQGGSAEVYRVEDPKLGVERALKLLMPRAGQENAEVRFEQEIRICRSLRHPQLVQVHDAGISKGRLYYTMELLAGMDLREYLDLAPGRGLSVSVSLEIALGVVRGLGAVHQAGIVHRDIKPANVQLVPGPGRVKLVDFGIAVDTSSPLGLTEPDMIVGTPAYVSPERVFSGAPPTAKADLYAVGAILYEMLSGQRPFEAPTIAQLFTRIARDEPRPIREVAPKVPREVEALVSALMDKQPVRRPASAQVVEDALAELLKRF